MSFPGIEPGMTTTVRRSIVEEDPYDNHLLDEVDVRGRGFYVPSIVNERRLRLRVVRRMAAL